MQYALKLLGPAQAQEVQVSFEREVKSTFGLNHPNLLNIHDYGEAACDGQLWLFTVAEYCSDGDYRRTLSLYRQNSPSIQTVIHDMEQILQGLEALHARIIHRDLKPANILCVGETLKITDFGLAKFVDVATRTFTFKGGGTPLYMAPETWLMKRATPATDLYALGIMFFEALTGQPPFLLADVYALRDAHLFTPAPRIKSKNALVPDLVDGIIAKLLTKEPGQRYQTAGEVLSALESLIAPAPPQEIAQIAERLRRQHDAAEGQRLEQLRQQAVERDERALIHYMEKELVRLIDEVVEEINANLVETKIEITLVGGARCYRFGRRTLKIHFFEPGALFRNPEVPGRMAVLRNRYVVHEGFIEVQENGDDREGWNVVLVRPPESPYGEWRIVETRVSALTGRITRYEPIATEATLFADNLANHWTPAVHIYTLNDKLLERGDVFKVLAVFVPQA